MIASRSFSFDYYEELQACLRAILITVGSSIPPEQIPLLNELVDAAPGAAPDLTEALWAVRQNVKPNWSGSE